MKIQSNILFALAFSIAFMRVSGQIQYPSIPNVVCNSCPQEGCQFGEWIILSQLNAFTNEGDTTSVAFQLISNEKIIALRGNVHVLKPGLAILPRMTRINAIDTSIVTQKIDTAYVLVMRGEGSADIWCQNRLLRGVDEMTLPSFEEPEIEWWVLFKNMKNEQAWLKIRSDEKRKIYGWNIFLLDSKQ